MPAAKLWLPPFRWVRHGDGDGKGDRKREKKRKKSKIQSQMGAGDMIVGVIDVSNIASFHWEV